MTPLPTEIRVEDAGATMRTIELTGNWRRDLRTALDHEHGACEDESCDIREALERGYVLVAASLLSGATEVPVLDAVRHAYEGADAIPEGEGYADMAATPDWEGWTAHFDEYARECPSCGSFTWAHSNYEPEQCANCLASLMRDYVILVAHHVRSNRNANATYENFDPSDADADDVLYQSSTYEITPEQARDPDFSTRLYYGTYELPAALPFDEEGS